MSLLKVLSSGKNDDTKSVEEEAVVVEIPNVELTISIVDEQEVWLTPGFGSVLT